jgi:HprK-related kinase A
VKVADIPSGEFSKTLHTAGIHLCIGRFVVHIRSSIPALARSLHFLYAQYPLEGSGCFADLHVGVTPPQNLRRWIRPQVVFFFDEQPPFKPLPLSQAVPLFEWGLNWCFACHLNQVLVIHAAVLEKDGHGMILPGAPGSGKSTLSAALVQRGWRLLSDEFALISPRDGSLIPLPRPISLKNESIEVIQRFAPAVAIGPSTASTNKGLVAHMRLPEESIGRSQQPARPAWLIFPRYQSKADVRFEPYPKARAFMRAAQNAFNYSRLGISGFHTLAGLVEACSCYDLMYGDLAEAMKVLSSLARASDRIAAPVE